VIKEPITEPVVKIEPQVPKVTLLNENTNNIGTPNFGSFTSGQVIPHQPAPMYPFQNPFQFLNDTSNNINPYYLLGQKRPSDMSLADMLYPNNINLVNNILLQNYIKNITNNNSGGNNFYTGNSKTS
jgi:hypothetical protein